MGYELAKATIHHARLKDRIDPTGKFYRERQVQRNTRSLNTFEAKAKRLSAWIEWIDSQTGR